MMYYTYVIESVSHPENRYIGYPSDLKTGLIWFDLP